MSDSKNGAGNREEKEELRERKKQLRRLVASRRKASDDRELEERSAQITEQILQLDAYKNAGTVFAYMDLPGEVRTGDLIRQCLRDGKKVAIPRVEGKEMHFYGIGSEAFAKEEGARGCLSPGAMGILEPDPAICPRMDGEEDALMIMPGVAFDRSGNRIGYGGGYYDRYLKQHSRHVTVAVAFTFQVFDRVPCESTDIRPQFLVTG